MRGIITGLVKRNKGSLNDPSFAFKASIIAVFVFLILSGAVPETEKVRGNGEFDLRASERLAMNRADIFSGPRTALLEESPDLMIAQGNTVYASTPLFMPETQVLGVHSLSDTGEKDIISYTVRSGDSLDGIASRFGVSRNTIIWANDLKNSTIRPGQELAILPVSGVFHIVASGDTVDAIASKYKADASKIIEFNELAGKSDIRSGDILIVPGGEIRAAVVAAAPRAPSTSSSWLIPPASGYISQGLHWYNAVDIATNCGAPIYASAAGSVQATGYHPVGGNFVRILHSNGVVTYYGHMSRIGVSTGQTVSQGAQIGNIGNTGYTVGPTGCHVHFEVRGATNPFANYPRGYRF